MIQFQEQFLQAGFQGGELAARTLLSSLPSLATISKHGFTDQAVEAESRIETDGVEDHNGEIGIQTEMGIVIVQVFLHKSGLGSALTRVS